MAGCPLLVSTVFSRLHFPPRLLSTSQQNAAAISLTDASVPVHAWLLLAYLLLRMPKTTEMPSSVAHIH